MIGNGVNLTFNIGTNILFLKVYNPDGSVASNATVKGYFREYNEDGTYIEKSTVAYTTDINGVVAIQGDASANNQQFCYTINSEQSVQQGKTEIFKLQDSVHSSVVELPQIGSLIDASQVANEVDKTIN